jgi:hypothetical protein
VSDRANWYAGPVPAVPYQGIGGLTRPRCGRCRTQDGEILSYPCGNFHAACAVLEQADDDAWYGPLASGGDGG